jgi:ABC-type multidrug transport system permease subunit
MFKSLLVALKEVKTYLQDRGDLAFSLLLPIAIFALMYGAFGGQSLFHGTANIVNEDRKGTYSKLLIDRLEAIDTISINQLSAADADSMLDKSDILLVLIIPEDFSANLSSGKPAELVLKQRGNGGQEGQIVAGIIKSVTQQISQELQVQGQVQTALAAQQIPASEIRITVQKYLDRERLSPTVGVNELPVGTSPDPIKQFLPGIITMFVLFSITLNASTFVEERKKGTLERLMTTRLTANQLFLGKFLSGIFRGFVQTLILLALAYLVFRLFTPVSFLEALLIALVFAAAASAIGLVIAVLVRTENAATWFAVVVTMAMTMLGGTFFTITPGTIWETLSKLSINTYANQAINSLVLQNARLSEAGIQLLTLAGVALAGLIISRIFFRVIPGGK